MYYSNIHKIISIKFQISQILVKFHKIISINTSFLVLMLLTESGSRGFTIPMNILNQRFPNWEGRTSLRGGTSINSSDLKIVKYAKVSPVMKVL